MKLGVVLPLTSTLEAARSAEQAGVDSVWVSDHFTDDGLEAITTMAAVAVATERVEIGAYMLNASLRDQMLLAKAVGSLARLAPGRIRILLGTGWDRSDYEELGVDFPSPDERSKRTAEVLALLKRDTCARVEVAGVRDDVIALAAAEADGWALSADALDAYFERVTSLRRACEEADRDVESLCISCTLPDIDSAPARIADLAGQGVEEFRVVLDGDADSSRLERLVRELRGSTKAGNKGERMIGVGNLELWTESLGDSADPTVLLITGPGPGIMWPDQLCDALVEGGRHVIRYDHRDTGRSTYIDFSNNPYTRSDLAADAIGVLDAYGVPKAHLVGFSGGGMIAQTIAIEHPDRVASLTSWGSTPLGDSFAAAFQGGDAAGLPGPGREAVEALMRAMQPADDEEEAFERFVGVQRAFAGTLEPVDEDEVRVRAKQMFTHTRDPGAAANHFLAGGPDRTEALANVSAPTLVIHGTVDPGVPLAHGEATAKAIPGATLLTIDGMGHDMPRAAMPQIVSAILEHTAPVEVTP